MTHRLIGALANLPFFVICADAAIGRDWEAWALQISRVHKLGAQ